MPYKNKEDTKAYANAYYQVNKDKIKANYETHKEEKKAYHEANKEKFNARSRSYYQSHKDDIGVSKKAYQKANPEKIRAISARRRAKKASVVNLPIRADFEAFLIEVWDNKCAYCHQSSDKYHMDHFMPIELKGHHAEYNLVLACSRCNRLKWFKHPFAFIKEHQICFTFKPYMKFPY